MNLISCLILSIITSITFFLNISTSTHIFILNKLFNTKIFNNNLFINFFYFSFIIIIIYNFLKINISSSKHSKIKKYYLKYLYIIITISILNIIIYYIIPHFPIALKTTPFNLLILSLIILFSNNKKGIKKLNNITFFDSLFISLSSILTIIPTINPIISNLLFCKIRKINKTTSLKLSFISNIPLLILKAFPSVSYIINNKDYYPLFIIGLILSIFISQNILSYFKDIYNQNKLYKLSIYTSILAIFLIYWYR